MFFVTFQTNGFGRLSTSPKCRSSILVFNIPSRTLIPKYRADDAFGKSSHLRPQFKKDKIPDGYSFSYGTSNINYINYMYPSAYVVCFIVIGFGLYSVLDYELFGAETKQVSVLEINDTIDAKAMAYFCLIVSSLLLVSIFYNTRNSVLRLYYNKSTNDFIAIISKYGFYNTKVHVKPGEVTRLKKMTTRGNVKVQGMTVWCSEENFVNPVEYNLFMGFDKSRQTPVSDDNIEEIRKRIIQRTEKNKEEEFLKKYGEKRRKKQYGKNDRRGN